MESSVFVLVGCFFLIALVYASVGFGGGSSYLALLAQPVFALAPEVIRPTALLCNIVVVTGGTILFYREKKIVWKEVWPFLAASVPTAYLGGLWKLSDHMFFVILGSTLVLASIFLWIQPRENDGDSQRFNNLTANMALGSSIGLLSGLVSIGGGIFLSPVLHILRWAEAKKISALASLFILVNSVSGLAGQLQRGLPELRMGYLLPLLAAVLAGGQLGSWLGSRKFNPLYIKRITALLIFLAGVNILRDHL